MSPKHPHFEGKRHPRLTFKIGDWVRFPNPARSGVPHFAFGQVKGFQRRGRILLVKPKRHFQIEPVEASKCTLWKKAMHDSPRSAKT
ncbi:MAG: hypothetical protein ACO395_07385 [Pontimonas sp.]